MYESYTPHKQNHLVGVSAAVIVTGLAALCISAGLAKDIIMPDKTETVMAILDAPEDTIEPVEVEPMDIENIEIDPDTTPIDVVIPDIVFDIPTETPIAVDPEPVQPTPTVVSGSNSVAPKLIVNNKPPYPPQSVRAQEQGVTTISVCVSENGRTQSAQVTESSGHSRLDEAALTWMKNARFRPAKVDGKSRAVCNHTVAYEWNLKDAR